MNRLKFTLKAWPVIAIATIGLCFITQLVAGWFGMELDEQSNVELVRAVLRHAFDAGSGFIASRQFWGAAFLVAQVVVIMPVIEELLFRWLLFRLPLRLLSLGKAGAPRLTIAIAVINSMLFSAAHYLVQPWPDNAFIALFFFGLAQCWLYRKADRLWTAMLDHALFNLTNLTLLFVIPK